MKKTLIITMIFLSIKVSYSQAITGVKTLLFENKYGNAKLLVTPNVTDVHAKKPTTISGVYAILVCYTYKGKQKASHQDLTYDFDKKGEKKLFLGMGATLSNIVIENTLFYRRDLTPKDEMPKKADCFK